MLHELLGLSLSQKEIVSICGGGGKTSLMYALARESAKRRNTAVYTTTHIFCPREEDVVVSEPFSAEEAYAVWDQKKILSAGRVLMESGKLGSPADEVRQWIHCHGDGVYAEADGSKRLPLKYPASWEPVLAEGSTCCIVVAGLSALDQPREHVVHRAELAASETGYREAVVTEAGMAGLLWAGYGRFDPVYVLNQADTPELECRGRMAAKELLRLGARKVVVISLKNMGH